MHRSMTSAVQRQRKKRAPLISGWMAWLLLLRRNLD